MLRNLPVLALLLLSLIWGYSWVVIKIALQYTDPFTFSALRVTLGALCLLLLLAWSGRALRPVRIGEMAVLGFVQTAGYVSLSMWAAAEGAAGRTAFLVFTMPFWIVLLAWSVLDERMHRLQWLAALLGAAGLLFILQPWQMGGDTRSKILAIAAGLVWAVSAVMVKRMQARAPMDLLTMTTWQMIFGAIPLIVLMLLVNGVDGVHVQWTSSFMSALAFNAIATTAAGWWLWLYVLHALPTGVAGMSTFAIPVIAVLSSSLQLGEKPDDMEAAGMVLIGLALLVLSLFAVRQHREVVAAMGQE